MSRIQDLLAKQKGTESVSQNKPAVAQSIEAEKQPQSQQSQPKSSLLQKLGKKPAGEMNVVSPPAVDNATQNSVQKATETPQAAICDVGQKTTGLDLQKVSLPADDKIATNVVAKSVEKPLSLMQRRLLESKKNVQNNPPSVSVGTFVQLSGKKEETHSVVLADSPQLSASQSADAQKINDGAANIEELKRNLAYLANNIDNKDLVAQIVRTIALQIKNNTELQPHMTNADVNLMVRGLRMSYQVAAMNKQAKADGRAAKGRKASEVDNIFKDAGIDFNFKF